MTIDEPYNHLTDPRRKARVTASLVGAILGNSPWMTRDDAMRAMVRNALDAEPEFKGNIATEWGNANEAGAIMEFEMETGLDVDHQPGFVTREDWAGCSPDGWVSDGGGHEQKCPYGLKDEPKPVPFKALWVQPQYLDQVQFSLWVTEKPHWYFAQWTPNDNTHCKVEPDIEWQNENLPKLRQFHAEFLHELDHNADEHLAPKRITIDTPEAARMVREWDEITEQLELLTERKKDLLADMVALAKDRDAEFAGRKLTRVKKDGAISYAKAIKELCPDASLEKWRGKASEFWKMT